ncbi:MAG: DUF6932 family protein [Blastocatellia bacterium]
MIPPLTRKGLLPPGIHWTTWDEFAARYGGTPHRERLLAGLRAAIENLEQAGCREIYIDGSFVTRKVKPNDFDACWNGEGVNEQLLDPVLLDFSNRRARMKEKYGGELFIAQAQADLEGGKRFLDYFQRDKRTGSPKGIIGIKLGQQMEGSDDPQ